MKKILGVMALFVVFCSPVYAAIMTFDSFTSSSSITFPYTEDGIRMTASVTPTTNSFYKDGVFHEDGGTLCFDMNGSYFNLVEIDFDFVGMPSTSLYLQSNLGTLTIGPYDGVVGPINFNGYSVFSGITWFEIMGDVASCVEFDSITTSVSGEPVPEPSTMLLLGSGLAGLVGYGRRRTMKYTNGGGT